MTARTTQRLLLCFIDMMGFARMSEELDDEKLAALLDRYYGMVGDAAKATGGTLVKTIGDGALLTFPPERADDAVRALLALRSDVERALGCVVVVKLHCGDVVAGPFGPAAYDVIGREVNITARIQTRAFALSAEAFRALSADVRKQFKKHTPPITYLPVDDRRPSALAKS